MEAILQYSGDLYDGGIEPNKIATLEALRLGATVKHIHTAPSKISGVITTVVLSYNELIAKKLQEFLRTKQKENVC